MAFITINFSFPLNVSVGVGDTAYFTQSSYTQSGQSGTHTHSDQSQIKEIGEIIQVSHGPQGNWAQIIVDDTNTGFSSVYTIQPNDFIMFSKDNKVNLSSLLGYYAKVKMVNNDYVNKSDLFRVGAEVVESSK